MALKAEEAREFKDKARMMYFSNEVIDRFCATATPGQLAAAAAMLDDEQGVRERRKRDRLFGRQSSRKSSHSKATTSPRCPSPKATPRRT